MKQTINGKRGDVIELKITNENTEKIPETGIHLQKSRHVWLLLIISIAAGLLLGRRMRIR